MFRSTSTSVQNVSKVENCFWQKWFITWKSIIEFDISLHNQARIQPFLWKIENRCELFHLLLQFFVIFGGKLCFLEVFRWRVILFRFRAFHAIFTVKSSICCCQVKISGNFCPSAEFPRESISVGKKNFQPIGLGLIRKQCSDWLKINPNKFEFSPSAENVLVCDLCFHKY